MSQEINVPANVEDVFPALDNKSEEQMQSTSHDTAEVRVRQLQAALGVAIDLLDLIDPRAASSEQLLAKVRLVQDYIEQVLEPEVSDVDDIPF